MEMIEWKSDAIQTNLKLNAVQKVECRQGG